MNWRTNRGTVLSKGPCTAPGCRSSDAKTQYSDGHAYCFSCNTYFPAEHRTPMQHPYDRPKPETDPYPVRLPIKSTSEAQASYLWLSKYFLTDEEIEENFFWAPTSKRHVFAHKDDDGEKFYEARSPYSNIKPKTLQYGDKPLAFMGRDAHNTLVIVEDVVSAIRVGRQYSALPLFGCNLSAAAMAAIGRMKYQYVVMWLDCNKYTLGMEYAKSLGMLVPTVAIQTLQDPKSLPDDAILLAVENAIEAVEAA